MRCSVGFSVGPQNPASFQRVHVGNEPGADLELAVVLTGEVIALGKFEELADDRAAAGLAV